MKKIYKKDNWDKIMKLAEKEGFIVMTYGGVAILMCYEEQRKQGIYEKTQYACGKIKFPKKL